MLRLAVDLVRVDKAFVSGLQSRYTVLYILVGYNDTDMCASVAHFYA